MSDELFESCNVFGWSGNVFIACRLLSLILLVPTIVFSWWPRLDVSGWITSGVDLLFLVMTFLSLPGGLIPAKRFRSGRANRVQKGRG